MIQRVDSVEQYKKKLEKSNSIIRQIASDIKNITPIVSSDYMLFEDFFDREEKMTYGNSWLYVIQGTFGIGPEDLGYKYFDGENLCALSIFPKIEQPDIIMLYWIRPLGKNMLSIIARLANQIKQRYGISSYVKKIFPEQYEFLLQHGFHSVKDFPWHSSAPAEDDTYPELIYDREKTFEILYKPTNGTQLGRALKEVNKFKQGRNVKITSLDFVKYAWKIAKQFFDVTNNFLRKVNVSTAFDYYNMIFSSDDPHVEKNVLFVDDEPIGFYILKRNIKLNITNIYCFITLRQHYKCLTDLLKLFIFQTEKVKYINGGGSEDEGIHNFKSKYFPTKQNIMCWATNYF